MALGAILIGFLYALLYCAIIILIAYAIVWAFNWVFGRPIDANVYRAGQAVVGLLCVIVLVSWLLWALGAINGGPFYYGAPFHHVP
jgi:hypothetical protein